MKTVFSILVAGILLTAVTAGFGQPIITQQPQSCTNCTGSTATFAVTATGTEPLVYQWQKSAGTWNDLTGCAEPNLCLTNVQTSHAGDYRVVVTNADGSVTSDVAHLTVIVPPSITPTVSLQNRAVDISSNASFAVTASGTPPLSFQWRLDGLDLAGRTQNTLTLTNLQPADEGDYTVVVTNVAGTVTSEAARLWVVPLAAEFVKRNLTNQAGIRLPYFYLLPTNYTAARRYPLLLYFHGGTGDETMITTPGYGYPGYANLPSLKVFASYRQQEADPMILLWPARRAGETYNEWSPQYLQLASNLLDQFQTEFSVDTNRVYVSGYSQGLYAAWDLVGMRPGFFAGAALGAGWQGGTPAVAIKHVPVWAWCAGNDSPTSTRSLVTALRRAGGNPIYTEYLSASPDAHLDGIGMGCNNPAFVAWLLAQRRGVASTHEPLLSITSPPPQTVLFTGATNLNLAGSAAALGRDVNRVTWTNFANNAKGVASGTNLWSVTNIPLVPNKTNVITVDGTTTSWAPAFRGNTTFNDTLTVIQSPLRATLAWQGTDLILNWAGGAPPYTVQGATDLTAGDWVDYLTDATPPVILPLTDQAGFYRVVGK